MGDGRTLFVGDPIVLDLDDPVPPPPSRGEGRVTLAELLEGPSRGRFDATVVNLVPDYPELCPRVLLAADTPHVVIAASRALDAQWTKSLAARWRIEQRRHGDVDVIRAALAEKPEDSRTVAVRYALDHAWSKTHNAFAEGLIAVARSGGDTLTQRNARASTPQRWADTSRVVVDFNFGDHRIIDLPAHALVQLLNDLRMAAQSFQ